MYIMPTNNIESIISINSSVTAPATNAIDYHILNVAKSTTFTDTFTLQIKQFNTIAIYNSNATYCKVYVDGVLFKEIDLLNYTHIYYNILDNTLLKTKNFLIFFDEKNFENSNDYIANAEVKLEFTTTEEFLKIGLIYAGFFIKYGDSLVGSDDQFKDGRKFHDSEGNSPLIVAGRLRVDKKIIVNSTKSEYLLFWQLMESVVVQEDESKHYMVVAIATFNGVLDINMLKFGIVSVPKSVREECGSVDYELTLNEGV